MNAHRKYGVAKLDCHWPADKAALRVKSLSPTLQMATQIEKSMVAMDAHEIAVHRE